MENDEYKAMSREEELQQAADEWAEFYKHNEDVCDYISVRIAYKEGAAWADAHQINVWHDVSEEPIVNSTQIIYQDKLGVCWSISRLEKYVYDWDWTRFASAHLMVRWAYISDLLPKGGE